MDKTLDDIIEEQCYFEDSALEDAIAYAQKIARGIDRKGRDDTRRQSQEES